MNVKICKRLLREIAYEASFDINPKDDPIRVIKENSYKINWGNISANKKLNEAFIREFKDYVIWFEISLNQKLSEPFIIEFKNKVDWYSIFLHQTLTIEFQKKYSNLYIRGIDLHLTTPTD
jgi:hypothetical protein